MFQPRDSGSDQLQPRWMLHMISPQDRYIDTIIIIRGPWDLSSVAPMLYRLPSIAFLNTVMVHLSSSGTPDSDFSESPLSTPMR